MHDAEVAQRASDRERYAKDLREFDEKHPVDSRMAVANLLQRFLDACHDVDFDAKLISSGGRTAFAKTEYEQKPGEWKMCFRAGREPMTAARTAAQAWLKELGR